jgi:Cu(I)/Ag(I) efflux system periplasmic protein CusF
MKSLKHVAMATVVCFGGLVAVGAQAQSQSSTTGVQPSGSAAQSSEMTEAEVRKVDKGTKKITLKHGAIKNLDMPPMTMVFQVSDPSMLEKVQAGDKVRFKASGEGGKFTVTDLQAAK